MVSYLDCFKNLYCSPTYDLRLVNLISNMFNIIPKPEYAKFYIPERKKKLQKVDFFMILCQANE